MARRLLRRKAPARPLARLDGELAFGTSPDQREVRRLARKEGFRSILCLNTEGEPDQDLSPNVEASWAHTYQLAHERVSVDRELLGVRELDACLRALARLPRPVYVHSRRGRRAGAVLALVLGVERGLDPAAALARADELGLDPGPPSRRRLVAREIERRSGARAA